MPLGSDIPAWTKWAASHPFLNGLTASLAMVYLAFAFRQPLVIGIVVSLATGLFVWLGWRDSGYLREVAEKRYGSLDGSDQEGASSS